MDSVGKVGKWIYEVLSQPSRVFGDLPPCPFAKKSWDEGGIDVLDFISWDDVEEHLDILQDVMIFMMEDISSDQLVEKARYFNDKYPHLVFLEEHPDLVEEFDGVTVNSGYTMLIVQDRKHLVNSRKLLEDTDYYYHWSPELKQRILDR